MTKKQYRQLRNKWYKKLAAEGFQDIEDVDSPNEYLKSWSSRFRKLPIEHYQDNLDKYLQLTEAANYLPFASDAEREVWAMYCDGHGDRTISKTTTISRHHVKKILKKLKGSFKNERSV